MFDSPSRTTFRAGGVHNGGPHERTQKERRRIKDHVEVIWTSHARENLTTPKSPQLRKTCFKLQHEPLYDGMTRSQRAPEISALWFQNPIRVWFLEPETSNIRYLDSLGSSLKDRRKLWESWTIFFTRLASWIRSLASGLSWAVQSLLLVWPLKEPQIPSNRVHKALKRGTLGGVGSGILFYLFGSWAPILLPFSPISLIFSAGITERPSSWLVGS